MTMHLYETFLLRVCSVPIYGVNFNDNVLQCTCTVDTAFIEGLILHEIIPEKGTSSIIRKLTMDVLFLCRR